MTETPHPLDYNATINRMERGVAPVDTVITLSSIAISLKRIADMMEDPHSMHNMNLSVVIDNASTRVAQAINNHSTRIVSIIK